MAISLVHSSIELNRIDCAVWGYSMDWDQLIEWGFKLFLVSHWDWDWSLKRILVRTLSNWMELCNGDFDLLMTVIKDFFIKMKSVKNQCNKKE